jgi:sugar lactone lactonase YvrE
LRRLPVVCAVILVVSAAFLAAQRPSIVAIAADQSANAGGVTSASQMTVIATGISVRAIAVDPANSAWLYLTNAGAPNQVLTIPSAMPTGPIPNVRPSVIAGTGTAGSLGDGGAATMAQLDLSEASLVERSGVAIALDGTVYVADTANSTIRAIAGPTSTEPGVIRSAAGRWAPSRTVPLVAPMGIAVDQQGDLFIADQSAGTVDEFTASGAAAVLAHVSSPASIAVTSDGGTVFVASPETGAVFSIASRTHEIKLVAGAPSPSSNACTSTPPTSSQQLCPAGLAADAAGNLFVSDANSGRILRVDAKTAASSVSASGLNSPGTLAMDAKGSLYVAEQGNNRILAFAQVGTSQGSLSLTPVSASYGNEPSGGITATQSFSLSNISATTITGLNIPKATTPADFTVQSNSCTTTLSASSSCTLSIAFTPTTTGARSATLAVTDSNPADSASTVLTGTGDDYQLQLANGQLMSVSIQAGTSATFNLEVVPDSVFSGTVAFVCPTNLPTNTTCAFSTPTANVTPGTPAAFSVTFQTTGIINPLTTWMPFSPTDPAKFPLFPAPVLIGLAILLLWVPRKRVAWITSAAAILVVMVMLAGCKKGTSPASIGATPAGTTTMAVTANSQNASRALTITLNVVQE